MVVQFNEDEKSPRASYQDGRHVVTRTGNTLWTDSDAFALELMPPPQGPYFPQIGAALPGNPFLRVSAFEAIPFPGAKILPPTVSGLNAYALAQWTITYERPRFNFDQTQADQDGDPIPFLTHTWEGGGEFLTLPTRGLYWTTEALGDSDLDPAFTSSVDSDANAGLFIPSIEHQVAWHNVLSPPFSDIRDTIGKVNDAALQLATGTAALETLLFLQPSIRRDISSDKAQMYEVSYKFSERRVEAEDQSAIGGWNHFFRSQDAVTSGFYRMRRMTSTGLKDIYETADFSLLFPKV